MTEKEKQIESKIIGTSKEKLGIPDNWKEAVPAPIADWIDQLRRENKMLRDVLKEAKDALDYYDTLDESTLKVEGGEYFEHHNGITQPGWKVFGMTAEFALEYIEESLDKIKS